MELEAAWCIVVNVVNTYVRRSSVDRKNGNDIVSSFWDHLGREQVNDDNMKVVIRRAVIKLGLIINRILPARVEIQLLRAGGAMALKFAGADRNTIKMMGCWS